MALEMTSLAWREFPDTQARASVARCHESWWSTSATEISKRWRSFCFNPFRACRLPLSDPTSGRWISTVPSAIRAPLTGAVSQRAGHLFRREGLDHVAGRDPAHAVDADAALQALQHLAGVVLEALERAHRALAEDRLAALDPHPGAAGHLALGDHGARDQPQLGDREELPHLGAPDDRLADLRREHARQRRPH